MYQKARNVCEALYLGRLLMTMGNTQEISPRGARTLEHVGPVITEYTHPYERVLFNVARDANPFFHLFEGLWMLAGRNDAEFVKYFNKRMGLYSDDGESLAGAYGWRWRNHFRHDQINAVVEKLRADPDTRRAVIGMYDPDTDTYYDKKDLTCNTHVYFKAREGHLNMTVCCRSNDMIWGAYGANAVHFSMLQEYVAGKCSLKMGSMYQLSDSFHIYLDGDGGAVWERVRNDERLITDNRYETGDVIVSYMNPGHDGAFEEDMTSFFEAFDMGKTPAIYTDWWKETAMPMYAAFKHREPHILEGSRIDWHVAGREWLQRRGYGA